MQSNEELALLYDLVLDPLGISEAIIDLLSEVLLAGLDVLEDLLGVAHLRHLPRDLLDVLFHLPLKLSEQPFKGPFELLEEGLPQLHQ